LLRAVGFLTARDRAEQARGQRRDPQRRTPNAAWQGQHVPV